MLFAHTILAQSPATKVKAAVDRARAGFTYYSMQRPWQPPTPWNPFPECAVSWQSNNVYIVDDRKVDYEAYDAAMKTSAEYQAENEGSNPPMGYDYPSNVLWIEILAMTNDLAYLTLHNTKPDKFYQLLSKPTLDPGPWKLGEFIPNPDGTNQLYFTPVPTGGWPHTFYRAKEGDTVVYITPGMNAIEPNTSQGLGGADGDFVVRADPGLATNLVVHYKFCGLASNGVDFVTLPGTVTVMGITAVAGITVTPYADSFLEFEESLTLCLILTNDYLIDPNRQSATIYIEDNFGSNQIFSVVAAGLTEVVGIDYHPPIQSLLVSQYFDPVPDWSFMRISTNGVVTNWSTVTNLHQEKKIAVVQTTTNGFNAGEMFFGTGVDGVIGKISADGTTADLNWLTLTNSLNPTLFRGSFCFDQTGIFSNNLIAVTGGSEDQGGEVWSIAAQGEAKLLVALTNEFKPHLEGVITLENDGPKWGPWAGKIITGRESALDQNSQPRPLIHAIDTNGIVATFALGIAPEDFDLIPTNQDLYIAAYNAGQVLKISKSMFTNFVGKLLVTQEGSQLTLPKLYIVERATNDACSEFVNSRISIPSQIGGLEHATFAPITITNPPSQ